MCSSSESVTTHTRQRHTRTHAEAALVVHAGSHTVYSSFLSVCVCSPSLCMCSPCCVVSCVGRQRRFEPDAEGKVHTHTLVFPVLFSFVTDTLIRIALCAIAGALNLLSLFVNCIFASSVFQANCALSCSISPFSFFASMSFACNYS